MNRILAILLVLLVVPACTSSTAPTKTTIISVSYALTSVTPTTTTVTKGVALVISGTFTITGATPGQMLYMETCFSGGGCAGAGLPADSSGKIVFVAGATLPASIVGSQTLSVDVSTTLDHKINFFTQTVKTITVLIPGCTGTTGFSTTTGQSCAG